MSSIGNAHIGGGDMSSGGKKEITGGKKFSKRREVMKILVRIIALCCFFPCAFAIRNFALVCIVFCLKIAIDFCQ